jgi:glycosyltransferase involved in cell wall biosynthesis
MTVAEPLRVALLSYRGRPHSGGQGVYVRQLSRALVALGHRVEVIAGPPYPVLDNGIRLTRLPGLELYTQFPFRVPALRELRTLADVAEAAGARRGTFAARRDEFDLVHDNQSLGYGLLRLGLPVLATVHHPITIDRDLELAAKPGDRGVLRWYRFLAMQRRVARRLAGLVTVSRSATVDIVREFGVRPERISVTPLGADDTVFHADPAVPRIPGRIVTVASADVPIKGLDDLVRACALLPDGSYELVVVGDRRPGSLTDLAIAAHDLGGKVTFTGAVSDQALATLFRGAAVVCVPSRYEGFSLPAAEAMACGAPLVATTAGALPEVVGAAGVLVPPGDPAALAAALTRVLADDILRDRLGRAGVARAAGLTWRSTGERTVEAYRRLLAAPAPVRTGC